MFKDPILTMNTYELLFIDREGMNYSLERISSSEEDAIDFGYSLASILDGIKFICVVRDKE